MDFFFMDFSFPMHVEQTEETRHTLDNASLLFDFINVLFYLLFCER